MDFDFDKYMNEYDRMLTIGDVDKVKSKGFYLVKDDKGYNLKKKKGEPNGNGVKEKRYHPFNTKAEAYRFARRLLEEKGKWE